MSSTFYTLPEGQPGAHHAIRRDRRHEPITKAGLHLKTPFVQDVRLLRQAHPDLGRRPRADPDAATRSTSGSTRPHAGGSTTREVRRDRADRGRRASTRLDGILDGVTRDTISELQPGRGRAQHQRHLRRAKEREARWPTKRAIKIATEQIGDRGGDDGRDRAHRRGPREARELIIERARNELEPTRHRAHRRAAPPHRLREERRGQGLRPDDLRAQPHRREDPLDRQGRGGQDSREAKRDLPKKSNRRPIAKARRSKARPKPSRSRFMRLL